MAKENKKGNGILNKIEKIGNALPHPAVLFVILSVAIVIISFIVSKIGTTVTYFDAREGKDVTIMAENMLSASGLRYIFNSATKNFTGFAPLGTVLVAIAWGGCSGMVWPDQCQPEEAASECESKTTHRGHRICGYHVQCSF